MNDTAWHFVIGAFVKRLLVKVAGSRLKAIADLQTKYIDMSLRLPDIDELPILSGRLARRGIEARTVVINADQQIAGLACATLSFQYQFDEC